ncbi:MAG: DNA polymerase III subunit alpha [Elusimicrobiota bacterium]
MTKTEFAHLHNHSEYSLLDGMLRFTDNKGNPSEFLERLAHEHVKGLALTDHGNLYGAVEFYTRCRKVGLKPVVGCEFYTAKRGRLSREGSQRDNCHLTLLARTLEGYENLMALSSKAFLEGFYYDPRIDKELLAKHAKGLIVLSGCLKSELCQTILAGDIEAATRLALEYRDMLDPGSYYLELMDHGIEEQKRVLKALLDIHARTKIPLVATNDCHYPKREDHAAHEAVTCIGMGKLLSDQDRLRWSPELYFKSPAEMAKIFHYAPEALSNTLKIVEECNLEIPMGKALLPHFPVPEGFTQDAYLEKLCREGLSRLGRDADPVYADRLAYELRVIKQMGFSGYFLIVWDFIRHAKSEGVPVGPGRGSGAGALVCFCLGITMVDPIVNKLLFERFLNPDRISMPDLDIDFSDTGRERVLAYVREKYGHDKVAQIITFGSLKARLAIRDVGRVMGVPIPEVNRLAKLIPANNTLNEALTSVPELQEAAKDARTKNLLDLAHKVEGLKRHTGVHAAGIVITKESAVRYAPLSKGASSEVVTTQYDGDILPVLGLLKMDFLGLRNLTVIQDAVRLIRERHDKDFDVARIPFDDKKTYDLLASGKALGVFQLDSEGMRQLLRRLRPTNFEDISAVIALYRPGPMKSGMLDLFVERKHGAKKVRFEHPKMEPILKDTYGCFVYQEQVMEISKVLAGFTAGQADGLRKAMSKKTKDEFQKQRAPFVAGCKKNGIAEKLADKIYDQIDKFGGYGFNRSHTVAYGTIAYQTAYLKANYALEYFTALLTSEIGHSAVDVEGKENKLVTYLDDARTLGIAILPPDVQRSDVVFTVEGNGIRFGLTAVKNVGRSAAESVVASAKGKPFESLDDLCQRVDTHSVNRKTLESLIKAGALDSLMPGLKIEETRARLMHRLGETLDRQARIKEDLARGQGLLFGTDIPVARPSDVEADRVERIDPLHEHDLLNAEREVLGCYLSGHPLVRYQERLRCVASHSISQLKEGCPPKVRLAGILNQVKKGPTRKGEQMGRATLEDLSGEVEIIVFPKAFASGTGEQLRTNAIVAVGGRVEFRTDFQGRDSAGAETHENPTPQLIVDEILPLELAVGLYARGLVLNIASAGLEDAFLEELRRVLRRFPGRIPVQLRVTTPGGQALIETEETVDLQDKLFDQLRNLLGEKAWQIQSAS